MRRIAAIALLALAATAVGTDSLTRPTPIARPTSTPSFVAETYLFGSCAVTPRTTWYGVFRYGYPPKPGLLPPRTMVVSGRLATPDTRNLTVGLYWYAAIDPRPSIDLRLTRLDRAAPATLVSAIGYPTSEELDGAWDRRWYYRVAVDALDRLPTAAGCWKVELVGGEPPDVVILELRGVGCPSLTAATCATRP